MRKLFVRRNIIIGLIGICGFCSICSIIVAPFDEDAPPVTEVTEADPIPTNTNEPSSTATSTNEPSPTTEPTEEPTISPTETPIPTDIPNPTSTIAPTDALEPATLAPLQSGGLGLTREEWERTHELTDEISFFDIYGSFWATFFASEDERIDFLQWQQEDPETIEYAENLALTLIPKDSVEIRRYTPDGMPETTVILYKSEWLRETLTDENEGWINSEPGEFIVQYNVYPEYDGGTNTIIISLGNNP